MMSALLAQDPGARGQSVSACVAAAAQPTRGDGGEKEDASWGWTFPEPGTADLMAAD